MYKLSIITINLNNYNGLEQTIRSVIDQTYTNFEFLIIDGNSFDSSLELINQFKDKLTYWVSEADTGIYNAMNKGILKANGEYCLFLNSGDILKNNNILEKLFSFQISEDIILCRSMSSPENKQENFENQISSSVITFNDLFITSFNHQATLIKRSLFNKYGLYNEKYKIISDHLFIIKVLGINSGTFNFVDLIITSYNTGGISKNVKEYYETEIVEGYKEIIPDRIYADYHTGYLTVLHKMKRHPLLWFLFRVLCKVIRFYKS
jgi:glycosyltransferase involved in cell wall biosynthesis